MSDMVSMKKTKKEKSKGGTEAAISMDEQDDFPWGLRLDLGKEEIEKLGISMPAVGSEVTFTAKAKVIGVRESADEKNIDKNIEYQITDIAFDSSGKMTSEQRANSIYGDGDK